MRFELQESRNERGDHQRQKVFKVWNSCRDMRVLRRARLSGHYLLSMRERRLLRSTRVQAGRQVPAERRGFGRTLTRDAPLRLRSLALGAEGRNRCLPVSFGHLDIASSVIAEVRVVFLVPAAQGSRRELGAPHVWLQLLKG